MCTCVHTHTESHTHTHKDDHLKKDKALTLTAISGQITAEGGNGSPDGLIRWNFLSFLLNICLISRYKNKVSEHSGVVSYFLKEPCLCGCSVDNTGSGGNSENLPQRP